MIVWILAVAGIVLIAVVGLIARAVSAWEEKDDVKRIADEIDIIE